MRELTISLKYMRGQILNLELQAKLLSEAKSIQRSEKSSEDVSKHFNEILINRLVGGGKLSKQISSFQLKM